MVIIILWIEMEGNGILRRVGALEERGHLHQVERDIILDNNNNNRELIRPC
jgi:hypothetical protein